MLPLAISIVSPGRLDLDAFAVLGADPVHSSRHLAILDHPSGHHAVATSRAGLLKTRPLVSQACTCCLRQFLCHFPASFPMIAVPTKASKSTLFGIDVNAFVWIFLGWVIISGDLSSAKMPHDPVLRDSRHQALLGCSTKTVSSLIASNLRLIILRLTDSYMYHSKASKK